MTADQEPSNLGAGSRNSGTNRGEKFLCRLVAGNVQDNGGSLREGGKEKKKKKRQSGHRRREKEPPFAVLSLALWAGNELRLIELSVQAGPGCEGREEIGKRSGRLSSVEDESTQSNDW